MIFLATLLLMTAIIFKEWLTIGGGMTGQQAIMGQHPKPPPHWRLARMTTPVNEVLSVWSIEVEEFLLDHKVN